MSINHFQHQTLWWPHPHPPQLEQQQMEEQQLDDSTVTSRNQETPIPQHPSWAPSNLFQHQSWLNNSPNTQTNPTLNINLNHEENDVVEQVDDNEQTNANNNQVGMFEKPLTPSDVGKLNRLVIPKQYAEKYFPLSGESVDKGLLLSFEDELGKCWRFRYSYWNSSQSYVLTKGWSRYVKEKRLEAGDVILFERHRIDSERLFIGWRRRGAATVPQDSNNNNMSNSGGGGSWSSRGLYPCGVRPHHNPYLTQGFTVPYQPDSCLHAGGVQNQSTPTPVVANSKTLRLFGVDMECQLDDSDQPSTPDGSSSVTSHGQTQAHHHYQFYNSHPAHSSNRHNHRDITFSSQDVNQMMRNHQG